MSYAGHVSEHRNQKQEACPLTLSPFRTLPLPHSHTRTLTFPRSHTVSHSHFFSSSAFSACGSLRGTLAGMSYAGHVSEHRNQKQEACPLTLSPFRTLPLPHSHTRTLTFPRSHTVSLSLAFFLLLGLLRLRFAPRHTCRHVLRRPRFRASKSKTKSLSTHTFTLPYPPTPTFSHSHTHIPSLSHSLSLSLVFSLLLGLLRLRFAPRHTCRQVLRRPSCKASKTKTRSLSSYTLTLPYPPTPTFSHSHTHIPTLSHSLSLAFFLLLGLLRLRFAPRHTCRHVLPGHVSEHRNQKHEAPPRPSALAARSESHLPAYPTQEDKVTKQAQLKHDLPDEQRNKRRVSS